MNFELVASILELIGNLRRLCRKFIGLSNGNKAGIQAIRERRAENKSARFDSDNNIDLAPVIVVAQLVYESAESIFVAKNSRDVVKQNSGLRIIGNFAD